MPTDPNPEIYSFLKWSAAGLISLVIFLIGWMAVRILNAIKKNIQNSLDLGHENKEEIIEIKTRCEEREKNENRKD